jgi:hypothetical protein
MDETGTDVGISTLPEIGRLAVIGSGELFGLESCEEKFVSSRRMVLGTPALPSR